MYSPLEYSEFLRKDVIIFGGQAVNIWAMVFEDSIPELKIHKPYTSKDLDLFATLETAKSLKSSLKGWKCIPRNIPMEMPPVVCRFFKDNKEVEVLSSIPQLPDKDIKKYSHTLVSDEGLLLTLINPIGLLKIKLNNLNKISQSGRNDEKHLKMLILCTREFLKRKTLNEGNTDREVLRLCQDAVEICQYNNGHSFIEELGDSFSNLLPIEALKNRGSTILDSFLEHDLPRRWNRFSSKSIPKSQSIDPNEDLEAGAFPNEQKPKTRKFTKAQDGGSGRSL